MDTEQIEINIKEVENRLIEIDQLTETAENIQTQLNDVAGKELATFADETLANEEKTKKLIELRTLAEVIKDNLNKAKAKVSQSQDIAIKIDVYANQLIQTFSGEVRQRELEKATIALDRLLKLEKGEHQHFAQRARTVVAVDQVPFLSFVGGENRLHNLLCLTKLRSIFTALAAIGQ
jgi:DNA-binding ferritin-like protein (Dps family)